MRCSRVPGAVLRRQLGALAPAGRRALERHLRECAACAAEARGEEAISADLGRLREDYPYALDLTPRVMARVRALGEVSREELSARQLAWGSLAASAAVVGLCVAGLRFLPALAGALRTVGSLLGALWDLARPLVALLAVPLRVLGAALESAAPLESWLGLVPSLARAGALLCCTVVVLSAVFVLGRDLGLAARLRREEP